jgi:transposase-like protein
MPGHFLLKACNDSWRVDETSIKIKGTWTYLYRAVDSEGNTLEFLLSATRDAEAAKRFFLNALRSRLVQFKKRVRSRSRWKSSRLSQPPPPPRRRLV